MSHQICGFDRESGRGKLWVVETEDKPSQTESSSPGVERRPATQQNETERGGSDSVGDGRGARGWGFGSERWRNRFTVKGKVSGGDNVRENGVVLNEMS